EAILWSQPHGDRELVAAFTEVAGAASADVRLDRLGDVGHRQARVGDPGPLEAQVLLGSAFALGHVHLDDAGHALHALPNEIGGVHGPLDVVAAQLDLDLLVAATRAEETAQHPQPRLRVHADLRAGNAAHRRVTQPGGPPPRLH